MDNFENLLALACILANKPLISHQKKITNIENVLGMNVELTFYLSQIIKTNVVFTLV